MGYGSKDEIVRLAEAAEDSAARFWSDMERALDREANDIARRLFDGRGLTTQIKPCWAWSLGRDTVPLAEDFVAFVMQEEGEPEYALARCLFSGQGQFHPLVRRYAQERAEHDVKPSEVEE